ncbi:translational GTPase TypA [Miniphocaeibacter massiliensis]|uniref:translational GTPase TypA n=1 Tax=Miniphocaeibacter massiliensis TaxID=2041841 RepID=UPI000C1BC466|nr:translational GTPase TypA [Miniphocaeibacter massiliensis]
MMSLKNKIRNVAIIAHVDHGKTTLVDGLLKSSGVFRKNQDVKDRVMDSNDIERERGITILSKNTAVKYEDYKINIIDTPGHADFGGEVERVLMMADGVVLVVDAFEGPMPQTKFVLKKAFELNLPAIVCINKIDRKEARPEEIIDEILDLFIQLNAGEEYLDSPFIFASAREGYATKNYNEKTNDMSVLLETIIDYIPEPKGDINKPLKLLISTTDYSEYVGRIGIGKIEAGSIKEHDLAYIVNYNNKETNQKINITNIYEFEGLERIQVNESSVGNIVAVTGVEGISIGDTICSPEDVRALPFVKISEPTLAMNFLVNNSPFAGREGKFVTSRQIRNRLFKELETDVSLRVEETGSTDSFRVSGRGELHLSVLIENLRREGYEFQVSKPEVLFKKDEDGKTLEPIESITIDVDEEFVGTIIEKLGQRKAELTNMKPSQGGYTRLEFDIPTRGLIGYGQEFISDTKGSGVMNSEFKEYALLRGDIPRRSTGSLISFETGQASAYGLNAAQSRGILFVAAGEEVYEGMVIGSNPKGLDLEVNVCKKKAQTNIRSSSADEALKLSPPKRMSLEELLEFIEEDELVEITPKSFRLRKKILNADLRYKSKKNKK